jgi:hypothetical protein
MIICLSFFNEDEKGLIFLFLFFVISKDFLVFKLLILLFVMFLDQDLICFYSIISLRFLHFLVLMLLDLFDYWIISFNIQFCEFLDYFSNLHQGLFSVSLQILTKLIAFFKEIFVNNLKEYNDSCQNEIQVPH